MQHIFVTGISTEVGKTVASAILVEALAADYWKPVQAGELEYSDSHKVAELISNTKTKIFSNSYALKTPMSPHAAADIDNVEIKLENIIAPKTDNHLVIEGAGGVLVPLNETDTILDLIKPEYNAVVVSRHYLGSINHTLLTVFALQQKGISVALIFSGEEHPTTEEIIVKKTGATVIGRINEEKEFNKKIIQKYAQQFKESLMAL